MTAKMRATKKRGEMWHITWDSLHRCGMFTPGILDELSLTDGASPVFHIERMDRKTWHVGLGDAVTLTVHRKRDGKYGVVLVERGGMRE